MSIIHNYNPIKHNLRHSRLYFTAPSETLNKKMGFIVRRKNNIKMYMKEIYYEVKR